MPTNEEYYIEDFKCFRHYVLCYQPNDYDYGLLSIDSYNKENDISKLSTKYKAYNTSKKAVPNTFYKVVIFENIETIRPADFYLEEKKDWISKYFIFRNKYLDKFRPYFKKNNFTRCNKDLYFMKLNYKWEVSNISKNYTIEIEGSKINYRLATIKIPEGEIPKKRH